MLPDPCFMSLDRPPCLAKEAPAAGGEIQGNLPGVAALALAPGDKPAIGKDADHGRHGRTLDAKVPGEIDLDDARAAIDEPENGNLLLGESQARILGVEVRLDRRVG